MQDTYFGANLTTYDGANYLHTLILAQIKDAIFSYLCGDSNYQLPFSELHSVTGTKGAKGYNIVILKVPTYLMNIIYYIILSFH